MLAILLGWLCLPVFAMPAGVCDQAARDAAARTGVPLSILRAVSLAETGHTEPQSRQFSSWPWAIQSQNQGNWFADPQTALSYVRELLGQGVRNIDIGCFQLNYHWHGHGFQSLEDMILPQNNALYAAQFLQDLYTETGDWRVAVGQYHSRDDARAEVYLQRLEKVYASHGGAVAAPVEARAERPERSLPTRFSLVAAPGPIISARTSARPLIGVVE
jgi:hypothetical protein